MRTLPSAAFAIAVTLLFAASSVAADDARVTLNQDVDAGTLQILVDGKEAFVYQYGPNCDLTHFYPVRSPAGKSMTVQKTDPYPHHRSVWFGDKVRKPGGRAVEIYGSLYSSQGGRAAQTPPFKDHVRHVSFDIQESKGDQGGYIEKLVWEMDGDVPLLGETRNVRIKALGDGEYLIDITFTVTATDGDIEFVSDAVHYAWPYVRINTDFNVADSGGRIVNSEGGINQAGTNGKVADWVDYSNTTGENNAGLAILSHTDNARPHSWLTRDYGTFGPRRINEKSGKPFTLKQGESISRRVGLLVHLGDVQTGKVAQRYKAYVDGEL